jgi:hypothetical protein
MNRHRTLAWCEYVLPQQDQNIEIAVARQEFIRLVKCVFPRFLEQLRGQVYPRYAELVETKRREPGWASEAWLVSDLPLELPTLVAWAKKFNVADEVWIIEGALRTLSLWHRDAEVRDALDVSGFDSYAAVDTLSDGDDEVFQFEHPAWDPQFQRWTTFRESIEKRFANKLLNYEQRLCSLMESQGAVRSRRRYSSDHLAWFALYQLGGMTARGILNRRSDLKGDESTILKGLKTAADLLQWKALRKFRKLARPKP